MDKALFSSMVKELLLRDGYAELPGLGTLHFIVCPASFSDRGFTLNPPFKKLVFSSDGNSAAGTFAVEKPSELSSLYSAANEMPLQGSIIAIGEFIEELKSSVTPTQDFELPFLGKFRRMRDGSLFFVQGQDVSLCPSFDNLPAVSLKTLDAQQSAQPAQPDAISETDSAVAGQPDANSATQPAAQPTPLAVKTRKSTGGKVVAWAFGVVFVAALIFAVSLAVIGRTNPQVIDPLLYSEEQLDVLYSRF